MSEIQAKESIRIAKFMAECGVASRRKSEELILQGKVRVNGKVISDMATKVSDSDRIEVFGKEIHRNRAIRAWIFHKPKGVLTTSFDPQSRKIIYDILPKKYKNLISVGRLDYNTEGLLILTNNGDFSRKLELPSSKITRVYRVRVFGLLTNQMISQIEQGIEINGMRYQPCQIIIEDYWQQDRAKNFWLKIILTEGKNREIRNIFEHFSLKVSRLVRISYGPFHLEGLMLGETFEIPAAALETLI